MARNRKQTVRKLLVGLAMVFAVTLSTPNSQMLAKANLSLVVTNDPGSTSGTGGGAR